MRGILLICGVLITGACLGQDRAADLALLSEEVSARLPTEEHFKGPLKIYNKHISDQILNDCVYEHSCSSYSQGALSTFGLFKGLMMTCDRLSRCSRASLAETSPFLLTKTGKIKEHWHEYKKPE